MKKLMIVHIDHNIEKLNEESTYHSFLYEVTHMNIDEKLKIFLITIFHYEYHPSFLVLMMLLDLHDEILLELF